MTTTLDDYNDDGAVKLPLWKSALEQAMDDDLIQYGAFIPFEWLEGEFRTLREETKFRFELMGFVGALMRGGYMASERGCEGRGIRILKREEMAEAALRKTRNAIESTHRRGACLAVVDRSELAEDDKVKLDRAEAKLLFTSAVAAAAMRRKNIPSPEMGVKSIKQIQ